MQSVLLVLISAFLEMPSFTGNYVFVVLPFHLSICTSFMSLKDQDCWSLLISSVSEKHVQNVCFILGSVMVNYSAPVFLVRYSLYPGKYSSIAALLQVFIAH